MFPKLAINKLSTKTKSIQLPVIAVGCSFFRVTGGIHSGNVKYGQVSLF